MCRAAPIVYVRMSPARSSCQEATKYGASPGSMATYAARIRFIPMMNVAPSTLALCTRTPVRVPSTRTADASPIDKTSKAIPKPTPCAFCRVFRARVLSRTAAKFRLEDSSISAVAEPVRLLSPGATEDYLRAWGILS
jgi:hypothetical protein